MDIESTSESSELWGDVYAVKRLLLDDPVLSTKRYYYQRLEGDNFQRPSFLIKVVGFRNRSRNIATRFMDIDMMIQYFSESQWDALTVADRVVEILSGFPQTYLNKWDFTQTPPQRISISGLNQDGLRVPYTSGIRIDPDSVQGEPFQTEDFLWQAPITFSMVSPRRSARTEGPIITAVTYSLLTQELILPLEVGITQTVETSVTLL